MIHNGGRTNILSSQNTVCHEKIIPDLQSIPTGFNFGLLSKTSASDSHQHVSERETSPAGTHEPGSSVHSLQKEAYEVQRSASSVVQL